MTIRSMEHRKTVVLPAESSSQSLPPLASRKQSVAATPDPTSEDRSAQHRASVMGSRMGSKRSLSSSSSHLQVGMGKRKSVAPVRSQFDYFQLTFAQDTGLPKGHRNSTAAEKLKRRHQDSRVVLGKAFELVASTDHPSLSHIDEDDRANLGEDFKTLRRFDYDRFVRSHSESVAKNMAPNLRAVTPHPEVGRRVVEPPLPVLDYRYLEISSTKQLLTAAPRSGKLRIKGDKQAPVAFERTKGSPALFSAEEEAKKKKQIVVITTRDQTYAFEAGEGGAGRKSGASKYDAMFLDGDEPTSEEIASNQYAARHCSLAYNRLSILNGAFRVTLSSLLSLQLSILDLSSNRIQHISSDFLVDLPDAGDCSSDYPTALSLPRKESLYNAAKAGTDEALKSKQARDPLSGKLITRYMRRGAEVTSSKLGASLVFSALTTLYLHDNQLTSLEEIAYLSPVAPTLLHLTLHGNAALDEMFFHQPVTKRVIVQTFPKLVSLNFTTLTPEMFER